MRILLDTNVILDVILSREPYLNSSAAIFTLACQEKVEAFVTASSVTDIYYIVNKRLGDTTAREALRNLLNIFSIVCVDGNDCLCALDLPIADFEDALITVCAVKDYIDYIISNDREFLHITPLPVGILSTDDFLNAFYTDFS